MRPEDYFGMPEGELVFHPAVAPHPGREIFWVCRHDGSFMVLHEWPGSPHGEAIHFHSQRAAFDFATSVAKSRGAYVYPHELCGLPYRPARAA